MTDREMLESAAKAVGNGAEWYASLGMGIDTGGPFPTLWNPLKDDGDALRLAVLLNMQVELWRRKIPGIFGRVVFDDNGVIFIEGEDANAATRRAIVRAAAAMAAPRVLVLPNVELSCGLRREALAWWHRMREAHCHQDKAARRSTSARAPG